MIFQMPVFYGQVMVFNPGQEISSEITDEIVNQRFAWRDGNIGIHIHDYFGDIKLVINEVHDPSELIFDVSLPFTSNGETKISDVFTDSAFDLDLLAGDYQVRIGMTDGRDPTDEDPEDFVSQTLYFNFEKVERSQFFWKIYRNDIHDGSLEVLVQESKEMKIP